VEWKPEIGILRVKRKSNPLLVEFQKHEVQFAVHLPKIWIGIGNYNMKSA
jgi:hypothetical protein